MTYDFVIVGAGSAGCVLAARLTEDPAARVLLLEAGPSDRKLEIKIPAAFAKLFRSAYDWNYTTEPQEHLLGRQLYWPRGKTLGGCSSINAQIYTRGHPADYDAWGAQGNDGWHHADVLPYFQRLENDQRQGPGTRGSVGPLHVSQLRDPNPLSRVFLAGCEEVGIEQADGSDSEGVSLSPVTQKSGRRWSGADAYLRPARKRPNLTVMTGAHAFRILFEGRRAVGVEYARNERKESARVSREVILAAGATNSPQLLMLSGVGPAGHLRERGVHVVHDLPGVGRHLQDHLVVAVCIASRQPISLVAAESPANLLRFLFLRKGMLTSNVGEACAFVRSHPALAAPDLELLFAPVPFIDHGLVTPPGHGCTVGAILLQPKSMGHVALRSRDPLDAPTIQPNYLSDGEGQDLDTLVHGVKLARRILRGRAFQPYAAGDIEPRADVKSDHEIARFVREQAETLYHPVGTCRMGTDAEAVVDARLRVHGIDGLRVVDASVMPSIVRGHTHAPTTMIAEKAADLIRR